MNDIISASVIQSSEENEIIVYQPDETLTLQVRVEDETVWLSQAQIIELINSSKANISEHIKHIFNSGELTKEATVRKYRTVRQEGNRKEELDGIPTVAKFATVQTEGNRTVTRNIEYYNLDVIISICWNICKFAERIEY